MFVCEEKKNKNETKLKRDLEIIHTHFSHNTYIFVFVLKHRENVSTKKKTV